MKVKKDLERDVIKLRESAVTIGVFDGVHLGHRKLIKKLKGVAKRLNLRSVLVTFDPYPSEILFGVSKTQRLFTRKEKLEYLRDLKVDLVVFVKFDKHFSTISAKQFVEDYLVKKLGARRVVVGEDFALGSRRVGNERFLREIGMRLGLEICIVRNLKFKGRDIKSSTIRKLIARGDVKTAAQLLGRFYSVTGTIRRGRSKSLGYRTANLQRPYKLIPNDGVYLTKSCVGNKTYPSITYIGRRPTFGKLARVIETYFFGLSGLLYGRRLKIEFMEKLRGDKKFSHVEALKEQIRLDVEAARKMHGKLK